MTTSSLNSNLIRFEESVPEVDTVATIPFEPEHFIHSHHLDFISSYDDLDFLIFASVPLPSGHRISLLRHQNAPYPGMEICLTPNLSSPSTVLSEALHVLNISLEDLAWVPPDITLSN